jgi:hypothetical protein
MDNLNARKGGGSGFLAFRHMAAGRPVRGIAPERDNVVCAYAPVYPFQRQLA